VFATAPAWDAMRDYPIPSGERHRVDPRTPFDIRGITFEAFPVEHSIRAPAVGYRITAGRIAIFYGPDLVHINDRPEALRGCRLYIGDGATMTQSFVRRRGGTLIGHAPVWTQLTWCQKEGVRRAIISHCGREIVEGHRPDLQTQLRAMAEERGVLAAFAHDGLELVLR
jgi:phosphoribosyl 1,2-cyclic phosphodiesterase